MKDNDYYRAADEQNDLLASLSAALWPTCGSARGSSPTNRLPAANSNRDHEGPLSVGRAGLERSETAAIRRYLNDGGVVIADSEPGLYDEHCHKRAAGSLHDCLPREGSDLQNVGKGKFILYRGLDSGYVRTRGYGADGEADDPGSRRDLAIAGEVLSHAYATSGTPAELPHPRQPGPGVRAGPFRRLTSSTGRHATWLASSTESTAETFDARLSVNGPGHLYDCRAGKYLGPAGEQARRTSRSDGQSFRPAPLPGRAARGDVAGPCVARPADRREGGRSQSDHGLTGQTRDMYQMADVAPPGTSSCCSFAVRTEKTWRNTAGSWRPTRAALQANCSWR